MESATFNERDRHMFIARAVVSLLILVPSISIILFSASFSDATLKWAIGSCGLVVGYWLR
jgi:hypothetical protein